VRLRDLAAAEDVWQLLQPDLPRTFPALRSLDSTPNNLPQQLTSFIGREKEMAEVKQLLCATRLLTLSGSGGCGKTRLAIHVAADLLESYPDGVWLVELAALSDSALVPQTVATVLGLREEPGKSLLQTLAQHLKSWHSLLVLDNAEHLLAACAQLADALLRHCPQVVVLVSSREPLGIGGEQTYRVPSLSAPDPKRDATPEGLAHYESARLFIERAQSQLPQFTVTDQNASALAAVCSRLDGIPLALELAAARMRLLSVEEVSQRLDHRFRLLTGGSRTALPRQQTLRSLIDWSYDLLSDSEKSHFRRLSVFAGGWTLELAEQVCVEEGVEDGDVLDLLTSLVDKSLASAEERNAQTRYRMLETVREYASDRLRELGEEVLWQRRHLACFLALAEEAEPQLTGPEQRAWLNRLETEHDNLRSALAWSSSAGDATDGLRLAGALWRFWEVHGYLGEGRTWLSGLLAPGLGGPTTLRANALHGTGVLAWHQGDYPAARALLEESLKLKRELEDHRGIASSLSTLGSVARYQGDYQTARALLEESLAIRRRQCDRWGIAASLTNLGVVATDQGDYRAARALHQESLAHFRDLGDRRNIAASLTNLGDVAYHEGDYPIARALHEESAAIFRDLGDRPALATSLSNLGDVACTQCDYNSARAFHEESLEIQRAQGDRARIAPALEGLAKVAVAFSMPGRAARLWGAAERLREDIGAPKSPSERPPYDRAISAARVGLGDDAVFDSAWQQGRAMSLEEAIEYALGARANA
jgi:non-specific serine/threonine protein kinase